MTATITRTLLIDNEEVKAAVDASQEKGMEIWQSNFRLTPERVMLDKYFRIKV